MRYKASLIALLAGDCHVWQLVLGEMRKMEVEGMWMAWHLLVVL